MCDFRLTSSSGCDVLGQATVNDEESLAHQCETMATGQVNVADARWQGRMSEAVMATASWREHSLSPSAHCESCEK